MTPDNPITQALAQIAAVLAEAGDYTKHVADIESLRSLALSEASADQATFTKEITTNKWYWLGMGTIADIALPDQALNRRFVTAYHDLATACEQEGLGSIYSRDVASVFGTWLKRGHV